MILREVFQLHTRLHLLARCQKRVQRNELARFYQGRVTSPCYPTTHLPTTLCTLIHLV